MTLATMYPQQPPNQNLVFVPPAIAQPSSQPSTIPPGTPIQLTNYTVTVERYLSQGGFAHVYLVRSQQPIGGTTSHVLKRIAVTDEVMLKEVQKEVDVMRILRGHPNIVQLIDSSSRQRSNGTYEVFILMEYCAGGGIIDMMNRRLRDRLTEPEILQVFIDVLEALACMHHLKPSLLHRDLKVENILQAGERCFKLCDFGSAATVAVKPPSTTAEIRALEQDIMCHTTLQYRAPEMVDVYQRLPIDEKSDIWALGVLLYKLCYYTTPFEEHGPLAILNVQYKIPSYPVYSPNMTSLISSMLMKYGSQRPTVFQLLDTVHRIRGTRSPYSYDPPIGPTPTPTKTQDPNAQTRLQTLLQPTTLPTATTTSIRPHAPRTTPNPSDHDPNAHPLPKTFDASSETLPQPTSTYALRRGRPGGQPFPNVAKLPDASALKGDDVYQPASVETGWKSRGEDVEEGKTPAAKEYDSAVDDVSRSPWDGGLEGKLSGRVRREGGSGAFDGFADEFDFEKGRGSGFSVRAGSSRVGSTAAATNASGAGPTNSAFGGRSRFSVGGAGKADAFDGLSGIGFGRSPVGQMTLGASLALKDSPASTASLTSPTSRMSLNSPTTALPPSTGSRFRTSPMLPPPSPAGGSDLPIEERFPSIEDYERRSPHPPPIATALRPPANPNHIKSLTPSPPHRVSMLAKPAGSYLGSRSTQTTGTAMRDPPMTTQVPARSTIIEPQRTMPIPGFVRRETIESTLSREQPTLPPRPPVKKPSLGVPRKPAGPPKDWLTGDEPTTPTTPPVLQRRPSASFIKRASAYGDVSPSWDSSRIPVPKRRETGSSEDEGPEDPTAGRMRRKQSSDVSSAYRARKSSAQDLIDVKTPTVSSTYAAHRPRAESPAPLVPESSSNIRFPSQSQPKLTPATQSTPTTRRPQSLFISPTPSSLAVPKPVEAAPAPESPTDPGSKQPRRHGRRNSIVDLVSKYEALEAAAGSGVRGTTTGGGSGRSGPPPPLGPKPTPPSPTTTTHTRNLSAFQRSAPVDSNPRTSPTRTSTFTARTSPTVSTFPSRTSPAVETSGRKSVSPGGLYPPAASSTTPGLRAPTPTRPVNISPVLSSIPIPEPPAAPVRTPSPERPYQGVASLINQWQQKAGASPQKSAPRAWK